MTLANEALQDKKEQREILKQQGQRWCCQRVFNVFLFVVCAFSFHTQRTVFIPKGAFFAHYQIFLALFSPHCLLRTWQNAFQQTASSYCQKKLASKATWGGEMLWQNCYCKQVTGIWDYWCFCFSFKMAFSGQLEKKGQ